MEETAITATTQPSDNRHIFFRYQSPKGTEILIGASLAWLIAVILLAVIKPEVFGIPAALTMWWKSCRGA